jgi:hypothetical protein
MKTLKECLEYLNKYLYSTHVTNTTLKAKEYSNNYIIHLALRDKDKVLLLLNNIIDATEKDNHILVHKGLMNLLLDNFTKEVDDFYKTEKARKFLED